MPPKFKFTDGDKVLCFHGPLLYEAKILRSQLFKDKFVKYFIHYAGWSKNWDEWVPESRCLKFTDANVQKQEDLSRVHAESAANKKANAIPLGATPKAKKSDVSKDSDSRASTPSKDSSTSSRGRKPQTSTPSDEATKKKRGRMEPSTVDNDDEPTKTESDDIKIIIPDDLKPWMVDDWDYVNRHHRLLLIPAKTNVDDIIVAYNQHRKTSKSPKINMDITPGILEYFNVMLGCQLLYKCERAQHTEVVSKHPGKAMSALYGSFHLLRLFVQLGSLLKFSDLDKASLKILMDDVNDLLLYLSANSSTLFSKEHFATADVADAP